jgi:hypothetical protein
MPKRFTVVEVLGKYYECERPYGAKELLVVVHWLDDTTVCQVEIIDAAELK